MTDKRSQPDEPSGAQASDSSAKRRQAFYEQCGTGPALAFGPHGTPMSPKEAAAMDAAAKTRPAEGPSPEWVRRMADREGDQEIGVGFESFQRMAEELGVDIGDEGAARGSAKQRTPIVANAAPRPVDPTRLEALRLAVQIGGHANNVMEAASRFLAFLDPASVTPRVPEGMTADLATEPGTLTPAAEPELPPYLAAEVGDVVEVQIIPSGTHQCVVVNVDEARAYGEISRLCVRWPDGYDAWACNTWIKRIVRKASGG